MKIWLKVIIGIALGTLVGFLLPTARPELASALSFIASLALRIGRSLAAPLVFCSLVLAVYQLHEERMAPRVHGMSIAVSLAFTAGLSLLGAISVLAVSPERIPILADTEAEAAGFSAAAFFRGLFPDNLMGVFLSPDFLYSVVVLAIFLGLVLQAERVNAKPATILFDSLSRVFYHLNSYFVEFLMVAVPVLAADSVLRLRNVPDLSIYGGLLALIAADVLIVALGVVPLVLYLACGRKNPYRWLYALTAPALAGLISGDSSFALGSLIKHAKESLGIRRRANAVSVPIALLIGRAGTAMVASVSFIIILRSYSSLGISFTQVLWVIGSSLLFSLVLGAVPGTGALSAVVNLCALYGRGFESGYLIIKPIALPLIALGAALDVIVAGAASLITAKRFGLQEEKETRFFI
jgi:Na+/H+-dicarboxylate symporter